MTQEGGVYRPQYNPISWGTLFFLLWMTLRIVGPNKEYPAFFIKAQEYLAWFVLVISLILFFSIFISPLAKLLKSEKFERGFVPFVFNVSALSYVVAWIGKLGDFLSNIAGGAGSYTANLGVIFGFVWIIAYLAIYINSINIHHKWRSLIVSSGLLVGSLYYLFSITNKWSGLIALIVALIFCLISAKIIPINYSPFPGDIED